jgi:hypothetical protein
MCLDDTSREIITFLALSGLFAWCSIIVRLINILLGYPLRLG